MPFPMFDSITVKEIPRLASTSHEAVAGYVGGSWPTYHEIVRLFPSDRHLSIAVNASEDAECLDVESGDAIPAQVPDWVRRQHGRGVRRPCIYSNLSEMGAVKEQLQAAGIPRSAVRLWVADWTYVAHIPEGYDACQWTDHAMGRNLDESLCADDFFDAAHPATVKPKRHRVVKVVKRAKGHLKAVHPKVRASTLAAIAGSVLTGTLTRLHVHISPDEQRAFITALVLVVGWLTPGRSQA